eukprot:145825_1
MATRSMVSKLYPFAIQQQSVTLTYDQLQLQGAPEQMDQSAVTIIGTVTTIVSIITWLIFVGWLLSSTMGGLGNRDDRETYFNWHPFLMTASIFLFTTPAILSFEIGPCSRTVNKNMHSTFNTLSFISMIIGLIIILDCHINLRPDIKILTSIHAICGWMTFVLLCATYLVGAILYGLGCCSNDLKKNAKPYHKRFGTFTLFCGYATCLLGLGESIVEEQMEWGQLMSGFIFLTMMGVVFTLTKFIDKEYDTHMYHPTDNDDSDQTDDDRLALAT